MKKNKLTNQLIFLYIHNSLETLKVFLIRRFSRQTVFGILLSCTSSIIILSLFVKINRPIQITIWNSYSYHLHILLQMRTYTVESLVFVVAQFLRNSWAPLTSTNKLIRTVKSFSFCKYPRIHKITSQRTYKIWAIHKICL